MSNPYQSPQVQAKPVRPNFSAADWRVQTSLDTGAAAQAVETFFLAEGYRLEAGEPHDAVYGIGNNVLRILFGAFIKRYKFKVQVLPSGNGSSISVVKGMSGAMGGAIGYSKMKKELARVREALQTYLS